ncbi:MAG: glycoside hydrolase family 3 N-terminal domain-containing protein [Elusimicrobia bacterium]|nr:glycoside hydrolase family 3 N-terminal domain-containing protein [Elusimicrobiota bacterium]
MNRIPATAAALLILCASGSLRAAAPADVEKRVEDLLGRMTVAEKLGQLQQLDGEADGASRPEHFELARQGRLGSTLNVRGARRVNELQKAALEARLAIPILFGYDVIHGYRTIFPIPLAEAASFDPAVAERGAAVAAAEAAAAGVRWTFAPMVDIARDARWGRIAEGSGEDTYLGSALARARVAGFQGQDYSAPDKVAACAKHWAAYGAAEAGRDYNTTEVSENTLRNVYFPPFRAAVEAGVATFMSAFNDLGGVPSSANPFTLDTVLRKEWGFDGFVVSDYTSVAELINHGFAADGSEAARKALSAGVDMEMVSRLYNQNGVELLKSGGLSMKVLDEAVRRVLRVKFRAGLFDQPYADESREKELLSPANLKAARAAAGRSMVLLRNKGGILPLAKDLDSLAVIGPLADDQAALLGSWIGDGRASDAVSILDAVRAAVSPKTKVSSARGCEVSGGDDEALAQAVKLARRSRAVVLVLGEGPDMSGEASSRSDIGLPGRQVELARRVAALGKPMAVVLLNGRPLALTALAEAVPALLEAWQPGTQGGLAVADVLFGDVNPGGKLPASFPRSVGQEPLYYNQKNTGRPPDEKNRYSSKYLDVPVTPLFPFGYGLSYTRFVLSGLSLSSSSIPADGRLTVSVRVENAGLRAGDEVVQLYIRDLAASVTRPVRELKGFSRVSLAAGEERGLQFQLGPEELGFYGLDGRFRVEPGRFQLFVGDSSVGGLETFFTVRPQGS